VAFIPSGKRPAIAWRFDPSNEESRSHASIGAALSFVLDAVFRFSDLL
jgi:hypothetical protein